MRTGSLIAGMMVMGWMSAQAGPEAFHAGTTIPGFGKIATVSDPRIGEDTVFKVLFDTSKPGAPDGVNKTIESAARFINMTTEAGVKPENIHIVVVIHGGAHKDLLTDEARGEANPNADMIAALVQHGVRFDLCGQTAAHYGVTTDDVLPGVSISLSAMVTHALLQQEGYTLNPF